MKRTHVSICFLFLLLAQLPLWGQENADFITVSGKIIDSETRKDLPYVSIRIENTNISTVSNTDGEFSLKVPVIYESFPIVFSYLGYQSQSLLPGYFSDNKNYVRLEPSSFVLDEFEVRKGDASTYMREVFAKIPQNYPSQPNEMVGFYRETIKKNNKYVSVTEAVIDIYKNSYDNSVPDQARIYKARRSSEPERIDTVFIKYKGGVNTTLGIDLAKNYLDLFFEDFESFYNFAFEGKTYIDKRPHYIISFDQREEVESPLFRGFFYIDIQSQAIAKIVFNMNIENSEEATSIFIHKKPAKMKIKVTDASYLVQYIEQDGKWYFAYSRASLTFKCRWDNRLFNSNYSIQSEMAVTDRSDDGASKFARKERLKSTDIIAEKVVDFEDENFWEDYNIIEPEQNIENAIKRLSRKLKRRTSE